MCACVGGCHTQITPDKSRVAPDELIDLQITYSIPTPGLLSTMIEIQVRGHDYNGACFV